MDPVVETPVAASSVTKSRIAWLDSAKGLGIILVVAFHAIGGSFQAGLLPRGGFFEEAFYVVYTFHMPFFFLLSGLLLKERLEKRQDGPKALIVSSIPKLLYPCFLWSYIQLAVIYSLGKLVNTPIELGWIDLVSPLWAPPSQFWFLYVLFVLQAIAAVTLSFSNGIVLASIALLLRMTVPFLLLSGTMLSIAQFAPFYVAGVLVGPRMKNWPSLIKHPALLALGLLAATVFAAVLSDRSGAGYWSAYALPASIMGTIALLALAAVPRISTNSTLNLLGQRSLTIFLAHVLFVAGTRIFLVKLLHIDAAWIVLPLAVLAGLAGPVLLYIVAVRCRLQGILGLS
jgi:fucose 4-O-acetylase-like acetyltransferase